MLIIIRGGGKLKIMEHDYPTEEQLFGLYRFLVLLRNGNIYWHAIEPRGDRIIVKTEPPKGDFDLRIFYVRENREVDPDDFRD